MNIRKKYKVIDSVLFNDEIDYLEFRFAELDNFIDTFVVVESDTDYKGNKKESVFLKNVEKFKKWSHKIVHVFGEQSNIDKQLEKFKESIDNGIVTLESFTSFSNQINGLFEKILTMDLNFDDIILFSEIDEIPSESEVNILQDYLSFEPIVFTQKDFIWSKDFIKLEPHLGTKCFIFSNFIVSKPLVEGVLYSKFNKYKNAHTTINSGYHLSHFYGIDRYIKKFSTLHGVNEDEIDFLKNHFTYCMDNLVYMDPKKDENFTPLIKYDGELPKNINMLEHQHIGRDYPKKHLVVIGIDSMNETFSDDYETTSIISWTSDLSTTSSVEVSDKVKIFYTQIPKEKYYDVLIEENTIENFQKMYFMNEIKKILIPKYPLDIDIFDFFYKGKLSSHSWSEIKDVFIYDLLNK